MASCMQSSGRGAHGGIQFPGSKLHQITQEMLMEKQVDQGRSVKCGGKQLGVGIRTPGTRESGNYF